jgi:raffinose/stachyose/melibiose transport system substrate-binding protein
VDRYGEEAGEMTKRVRARAFAAVAVAAVLLGGCTDDGAESAGGSNGGTITFSGQTQEQALWEELFAAFEKANPKWTVDATYTPNDSYPQLIQTQFQSGQAADVIQSTPGSGGPLAALTLAAGKRLTPLTGSPWVESLPDKVREVVTLDGEIYAYPTDLAPFFVAYNRDLFERVGVTVPTTFDELLGVCTKVADAGLIPIALAGSSFQNVTITLQTLAGNNVFGPDPDWNDQRFDGATTFAGSSQWRKVLSDFQEMIDARCYAPDVAGVAAPVHSQQFASQKAAMYVMPAQALAIVAQNATTDLNLSSFAFPGDTPEQTWVPANSGISLVVNGDARNSVGAKKLIDFLGTPAERRAYADHAGTIAYSAGPDGKDVVPEVLEPLRPYLEGNRSLTLNYLFWPSSEVNQQLATSAQGLLTGQKAIDQVLGDVDQAWDSAKR